MQFKVCNAVVTRLVLIVLLLVPSLAAADGQGRPATQAEKDYHAKVLQVFEGALPPAPEGWEAMRRTEIKALEIVGEGCEAQPMPVSYEIIWEDVGRRDKAMDAMTQAGVQAMQKGMADMPTEDLEAAYAALVEEVAKAADAGDYGKVQKLTADLEALALKMTAVYEKRDQAFQESTQAHEERDIKASVCFTTNRFSEHMDNAADDGETVAGWKTIRHEGYQDPHYGWTEGYTYVFLGNDWQPDAGQEPSVMMARVKPGEPHTVTQAIIVRIQASPERTEELLGGIQWEALSELLGR